MGLIHPLPYLYPMKPQHPFKSFASRIKLSLLILILTSPILLEAQFQNGLHFDGTDDYIQTNWSGISGTNARTVEAWIKTPFVSGQEVIVDWGTQATGQRFTFNLIDGKLRLEINGSGVTTNTLVGDSFWHHVAVTYDNTATTKYKIYLDGNLEGSFNLATAQNTGSSVNVRIGLRVDGARPFRGIIDEVRIWNYARTQAQINADRDTAYCAAPSGLVFYHRLNRGTAGGNNAGLNVSFDGSGNGYDGTLNNFALTGGTSNWLLGAPIQGGPNSVTIQDTACTTYTSPSGNQTWNLSGTYKDTLTNVFGCDSILTIQLTLNSTTSVITESVCGSYTSPSGNYTWDSTGLYLDTIPNAIGCDSLMTIDLTVTPNSSATLTDTACGSYTSPSGNYMWTATGSYLDTIPNSAGCDSVLTIDLTIPIIDTAVNLSGNTLTAAGTADLYTWLDCDSGFVVLSSGTTADFTPTGNGNYACVLSLNGCTGHFKLSLCQRCKSGETPGRDRGARFPQPYLRSDHLRSRPMATGNAHRSVQLTRPISLSGSGSFQQNEHTAEGPSRHILPQTCVRG